MSLGQGCQGGVGHRLLIGRSGHGHVIAGQAIGAIATGGGQGRGTAGERIRTTLRPIAQVIGTDRHPTSQPTDQRVRSAARAVTVEKAALGVSIRVGFQALTHGFHQFAAFDIEAGDELTTRTGHDQRHGHGYTP